MLKYKKYFYDKTILITGGTGSISHFIIKSLLNFNFKKIIIYSRDEFKQYNLSLLYKKYNNKLKFVIGDIRDLQSLIKATKGVDFVIHTAALKHVDVCENNPEETIKTNIIGSQNIVDACIYNKVSQTISLSTDKASMPINLYGASKLASDKLFIAANLNSSDVKFSIVRYGNVFSSRGSVYPYFKNLINKGIKVLPLTHKDMTRFWITPDEAVETIFYAFHKMAGGEIFIPKIRSFKVIDLIKSLNCEFKLIGLRTGEKIHETLICKDDSTFTIEGKNYYVILPPFSFKQILKKYKSYKKVRINFEYLSDIKKNFIKINQIKSFIKLNEN